MAGQDAPDLRMVTISASYGAGGSVVAPLLAERLGLPFADRLLPRAGDGRTRSDEQLSERELEQSPRSSLLETFGLLRPEWGLPAPNDPGDLPGHVQAQVEASLRNLLETTGGVVLGRAAAVPLAGHPRVFHVRLDGPVERRVVRGAIWEGVDVATAREQLRRTDAARSRYIRRLYKRDPTDPRLYHLILDGTVLSADAAVAVVATAAEAFWSYDEEDLGAAVVRTRARTGRAAAAGGGHPEPRWTEPAAGAGSGRTPS